MPEKTTLSESGYGFVLKLDDAIPVSDSTGLPPVRYNLSIEPGECVFVECRDDVRAAQFTDFCAGLLPVKKEEEANGKQGSVSCMGLNWAELDERRAQALRGRIGRITGDSGWIDLYEMHLNILWPSLHHSRTPYDKLVAEAVHLSQLFGLPGLPTQLPEKLSPLDRKRSEYVRAFMNRPSLLLLENPVSLGAPVELYNAFFTELTVARERGCAVLWIGSERSAWAGYARPGMQRFRLGGNGLIK
ncbi:ABC transporter ATP-binding protein [Bombella sp. TMW 2.2543]|uniref:ABC transporter ATP-binding protein n=1 Tax=Bombella pluederhausensis TaxID=2967336 RepID=A0ABT3WF43_9PROT|nr:ABC transporter ATP-binding protein [Bombella pluederhausensis]MCX5617727.1 ABC transporter ATP-binding protein [Bombella pluederhausensis]